MQETILTLYRWTQWIQEWGTAFQFIFKWLSENMARWADITESQSRNTSGNNEVRFAGYCLGILSWTLSTAEAGLASAHDKQPAVVWSSLLPKLDPSACVPTSGKRLKCQEWLVQKFCISTELDNLAWKRQGLPFHLPLATKWGSQA